MNPTQTGIAVALALAVVAGVFLFPTMFPFPTSPAEPAAADAGFDINNQNDPSTMLIENNGQLQTTDLVVGTGTSAEPGDAITVTYVGAFPDGRIFDASANHPEIASGFPLVLGAGSVIKGWDQGLVGMKEGGKRRLVVPPELGYGANDYGPIPGNSTLVFEVELLKVEKR